MKSSRFGQLPVGFGARCQGKLGYQRRAHAIREEFQRDRSLADDDDAVLTVVSLRPGLGKGSAYHD